MNQVDWVGQQPAKQRARIEIPNQRAAIAERKAVLLLQIRRACGIVPARVASGSIDTVRGWKVQIDAAMRTAEARRSSVPDLEGALSRVCAYLSPSEAAKVFA